jgi:hypothetical protein
VQGVVSEKKVKTFPVNPHWDTRFKSYAFAGGLEQALRDAFLDAEGLLMQSNIIKNSRSTTAGIFRLNGIDYFIKRSNVNGLPGQLRRIGGISRARRNALMAAELEKIKVITPQVYMSLDTRPYGLPGTSYLITECFPSPINVAGNMKALREFYGGNKEFINALAGLAATLHNNGIEHGDFKITNILALKDADGRFELGVFDLDGCRKYSMPCPENIRIKELARVASAYFIMSYNLGFYENSDEAENRRLFLQSYAEHSNVDFTENQDFHRRIEKFFADDMKHRTRND